MDASKLSEKSQSILNTFHAVTDTMRLINKGAFPGEEAAKLLSSLGFLRAVAVNAIEELKKQDDTKDLKQLAGLSALVDNLAQMRGASEQRKAANE